jgi:hypothetical protein
MTELSIAIGSEALSARHYEESARMKEACSFPQNLITLD